MTGPSQEMIDGVVLVGKGTRIVGEISDCSKVEIQGVLEGNVVTQTLIVHEGGGVKGNIRADQVEAHGVIEGILIVSDLLDVRSSGQVAGELTYGRLSVASGASLSGNLQNQGNASASATTTTANGNTDAGSSYTSSYASSYSSSHSSDSV